MCIQCSVCMEALTTEELWVVYNPPMCLRCEQRRCPLCGQYVNTQDEILDMGIAHHVNCFLDCYCEAMEFADVGSIKFVANATL